MTRASKVATAQEALAGLADGQTVIIGGSLFHNKPMHLVREIIRRGVRGLTVIAVPQASLDVDLLIGAGAVAEVRVPYLGFDYLGLAMNFRRQAGDGRLRVWDCDETQLLTGLDAAAKDLPSGLTKTGIGTDLPRLNPDLKVIQDPITAEPMVAVAAIRPDLAIIHAASGDAYGNLRYAGYAFGDLGIAEATKRGGGRVVASVDELVPLSQTERDPFRTDIAHMFVDAVVEAPFGAHPCSSHGNYTYDEEHLAAYVAAARQGEAEVADYIRRHVFEAGDQLDYLDRFVTPSKLVRMRRGIYV